MSGQGQKFLAIFETRKTIIFDLIGSFENNFLNKNIESVFNTVDSPNTFSWDQKSGDKLGMHTGMCDYLGTLEDFASKVLILVLEFDFCL